MDVIQYDETELLGETFHDEDTDRFRWRLRVRTINLVVAISGEARGFGSRDEAESAGRQVRDDVEWIATSPSGHPIVETSTTMSDVTDDDLDDPED